MSYLSDYLFYNSGNECPRNFHLWSALATLSTVVSRRVWLDRNYFVIYPNLYVCLVGTAGSGKSVAKDISKNLLIEHFPHIPLSASIQSREDIMRKMASAENTRALKQPDGSLVEYHPYALYINELANFVSIDPVKMVYFLVDIYDARYIDTGFKKDVIQDKIPNPYVTMLACTQPDWMMRNLKIELFSGGLGRRLIIVHERKTKCIDEPTIPPGGKEAWARVIDHLKRVEEFHGPMVFDEEAREWWKQWYQVRKQPDDPILAQFHETKHVQLQKVAMLCALSELPLAHYVKADHLRAALAMLDVLEPSIPRLSAGVGRNVLAPAMQQILDVLQTCDGMIPEKRLLSLMGRELSLREFNEVIQQLQTTEQVKRAILEVGGVSRVYLFLPSRWEAINKDAKPPAPGSGPESSEPL